MGISNDIEHNLNEFSDGVYWKTEFPDVLNELEKKSQKSNSVKQIDDFLKSKDIKVSADTTTDIDQFTDGIYWKTDHPDVLKELEKKPKKSEFEIMKLNTEKKSKPKDSEEKCLVAYTSGGVLSNIEKPLTQNLRYLILLGFNQET